MKGDFARGFWIGLGVAVALIAVGFVTKSLRMA